MTAMTVTLDTKEPIQASCFEVLLWDIDTCGDLGICMNFLVWARGQVDLNLLSCTLRLFRNALRARANSGRNNDLC